MDIKVGGVTLSQETAYYTRLAGALREHIFAAPIVIKSPTSEPIRLRVVPDRVLPDGRLLIDAILSGANLARLAQAFTDETFSNDNYELLEAAGDTIGNKLMGVACLRQLPHLNSEEFSNILAYYKSNVFLGEQLLLNFPRVEQLIRMGTNSHGEKHKITNKMYGDVFEALLAAVDEVVDGLISGLGDAVTRNVFNVLTRGFVPDDTAKIGHPKNVIFEIFGDKYKLKTSEVQTDASGKVKDRQRSIIEFPPTGTFEGTLTVTITRGAINAVGEKIGDKAMIQARDGITQQVQGYKNRQTAIRDAYHNLLRELQTRYGLTPGRFVEQQRLSQIMDQGPGVGDEVLRLEKQFEEQVSFKKKPEDDGTYRWRLVVTKLASKKSEILAQTESDKGSRTFREARGRLLNEYLESRRKMQITDRQLGVNAPTFQQPKAPSAVVASNLPQPTPRLNEPVGPRLVTLATQPVQQPAPVAVQVQTPVAVQVQPQFQMRQLVPGVQPSMSVPGVQPSVMLPTARVPLTGPVGIDLTKRPVTTIQLQGGTQQPGQLPAPASAPASSANPPQNINAVFASNIAQAWT
jgi:hypothetical protein